MKFNKKIIVASLSTALGLGIVGSITGTVAWYSYNTRVTSSIVGVSQAKSGILQFSLDGLNWKNTFFTNDIIKSVVPASTANEFGFEQMTFGALGANGVLPAQGYAQPEAGHGAYSEWNEATNGKEYLQFNLYIKAEQLNNSTGLYERVAKDVFLTDITLEDVDDVNKPIVDAFRIHLHSVNAPTQNYLISKNEVTNLNLYSDNLDLDGLDGRDKVSGYEYDGPFNWCMYGNDGDKQTTSEVADVVAGVDTDETIIDTSSTNPKLFKATTTTAGDNLHFVVTMWLEGWHNLEADTPMWDTVKTKSAQFHVGLTFNAGIDVFD